MQDDFTWATWVAVVLRSLKEMLPLPTSPLVWSGLVVHVRPRDGMAGWLHVPGNSPFVRSSIRGCAGGGGGRGRLDSILQPGGEGGGGPSE